jgi:hypothetical protein
VFTMKKILFNRDNISNERVHRYSARVKSVLVAIFVQIRKCMNLQVLVYIMYILE